MNARTLELLTMLTAKVRCLRGDQVARLWFGHAHAPARIAGQYLKRLERKSLVQLSKTMTLPEIPFQAPLLDWRPGGPEPSFDRTAWQAETRLAQAPQATLVVTATVAAQALTGGPLGKRAIRPIELAHDLLAAQLFEKFWRELPAVAVSWRPEDELVQESYQTWNTLDRQLVPDAVVTDDGVEIAIEIVGRYSAEKLRKLHEARRHRRYQLW